MAGGLIGLLVLPLLLGMLLAAAIRLIDTLRSHGAERVARARSLAASVATALAGFAASWLWLALGESPPQDIRLATLPALACCVAVLTAGVAERTWPQPVGPVRVANLSARRPVRHGALRRLLAVGLVGTGTALLVGGVTAEPDGRSFSRRAGDVASTGSPYPGWSYGASVGVAVALLAAATWFSHRQVEARPAIGPGHEDLDQALRRVSFARELRPAAAGALVTAAGLWLTLGSTLNSVTQNLRMNDAPGIAHAPCDWVQDVGLAGVGVGVIMGVLGLAALVWSAPQLPRRTSTAQASGTARAGA
jgi:hypothetical protein